MQQDSLVVARFLHNLVRGCLGLVDEIGIEDVELTIPGEKLAEESRTRGAYLVTLHDLGRGIVGTVSVVNIDTLLCLVWDRTYS